MTATSLIMLSFPLEIVCQYLFFVKYTMLKNLIERNKIQYFRIHNPEVEGS